jgi:hypothetical protein
LLPAAPCQLPYLFQRTRCKHRWLWCSNLAPTLLAHFTTSSPGMVARDRVPAAWAVCSVAHTWGVGPLAVCTGEWVPRCWVLLETVLTGWHVAVCLCLEIHAPHVRVAIFVAVGRPCQGCRWHSSSPMRATPHGLLSAQLRKCARTRRRTTCRGPHCRSLSLMARWRSPLQVRGSWEGKVLRHCHLCAIAAWAQATATPLCAAYRPSFVIGAGPTRAHAREVHPLPGHELGGGRSATAGSSCGPAAHVGGGAGRGPPGICSPSGAA